MKVTVLGKEYASSTSKKTGKDFAAMVVHVSHKKRCLSKMKQNHPVSPLDGFLSWVKTWGYLSGGALLVSTQNTSHLNRKAQILLNFSSAIHSSLGSYFFRMSACFY